MYSLTINKQNDTIEMIALALEAKCFDIIQLSIEKLYKRRVGL